MNNGRSSEGLRFIGRLASNLTNYHGITIADDTLYLGNYKALVDYIDQKTPRASGNI